MATPKNALATAGDGLMFICAGDALSRHVSSGLRSPKAKERYSCAYCKLTSGVEVAPGSEQLTNAVAAGTAGTNAFAVPDGQTRGRKLLESGRGGGGHTRGQEARIRCSGRSSEGR